MQNHQIIQRLSNQAQPDPLAETQPTYPAGKLSTGNLPAGNLSDYQPIRITPLVEPPRQQPKARLRCGCWGVLLLLCVALLAVYLFIPARTNILILGIDDRAPGEAVGRSDTMILATFQPARRYIGMLSIPRDLWVPIPGVGENRINTAHFFAEAAQPGSGPQAAQAVVEANFGVDVHYFIRVRFDNFMQIVDAMGGIEITLPEAMSGYPPGTHRLNAEQALAFVRDRAGSDDFSRMDRGRILLRSLWVTALSPWNIPHWPGMGRVLFSAVETDLPFYLWPKLGIALVWVGADGVDTRLITREMVRPFVTSEGAQVLEPIWELIRPVVLEMFGE